MFKKNLVLIAFILFGCGGTVIQDLDAGCQSNTDCIGGSLKNAQCGFWSCISNACVLQIETVGAKCLVGIDAGNKVFGHCNELGMCQ